MKTHNYGKIAFLSPKLSNDMEFVVISEIFGNICHHSPNLYPLLDTFFFYKRRNLFSTPKKNRIYQDNVLLSNMSGIFILRIIISPYQATRFGRFFIFFLQVERCSISRSS